MSALPIREAVVARLQELSDAEVAEVLEYIEVVQSQRITIEASEDDDPAIGFFSGPPDFAAQSKEILRREFGQKKYKRQS